MIASHGLTMVTKDQQESVFMNTTRPSKPYQTLCDLH